MVNTILKEADLFVRTAFGLILQSTIYQLLQHSNLHFDDLTRALPDCSRRMLALQLEELIADHVITKTVISLRPLKTEYQLSEFGQTLSPVINAMATWGTYYNQVAQQDVGYCNLQ
ncbi:winged helix-turn-helix transcriptional regulator [Latilactobacillus curvatus]|uniref:winged helix-turn-helix transcriptional regulator n=1 Tax=Latilactobacillus curvatus TaxID=28038 RepID=UPI0035C776FE